MARNVAHETDGAVGAELAEQPPKQWEIRAALRAFQRSREGSARRNPAEQMVAAAWELVNEQDEFTVKQVTERAGVALQTFYRHFGSKDELVLAMLEEGIDQGASAMLAEAAELDDPIEKLRHLVTRPITKGFDEAGVRSLQWRARERQRLVPRFPEAADAVHEPYRAAIVGAIEAADEAGLVTSANPGLDGNLIQHLVLTMTHLQWGGGFREQPDVTAEALWRLCWEGLGPRTSR